MSILLRAVSTSVVMLGLVANHAQAAKLCKLTGSYSDKYGSTTSITGKSGTILNGAICSTAYTFKVSGETTTGFTVTGKNKTKSCGTFSGNLTFMGSCSVFGGTATIHGTQLSDTFTKIANPNSRDLAVPSALLGGLHE